MSAILRRVGSPWTRELPAPQDEAARFLRALNSIAPGGFMDALFGVMALEKASLFVKAPPAHPLAEPIDGPAHEPGHGCRP